MTRSEQPAGQPGSPVSAPRFQEYLRQRLTFEHERLRLHRSRRIWILATLVLSASLGFSLVRPEPLLMAHGALWGRPESGSVPEGWQRIAALPAEPQEPRNADLRDAWARALTASLEQDRHLAAELVSSGDQASVAWPQQAYLVRNYPLPRGRQMAVYTSLIDERSEIDRSRNQGGIW